MKTILCSLMAALALISPASAGIMNGNLTWTGDAGYSFTADFTFHSGISELHESYGVNWLNPTDSGIINFRYSVYSPSGDLLATDRNVENGIRKYWYMEFHFDTVAGSLIPGTALDIGDDPGYWLGFSDGSFYMNYQGLIEDEEEPGSFYEAFVFMDSGGSLTSSASAVNSVPDGGAGILITGCLLGLVAMRGKSARRHNR